MIQLHGDESPAEAADLSLPVIKATTLEQAGSALDTWPQNVVVLLDAHDPVKRGGTGTRIDWTRAAAVAARRRVVLAGGLTPENVREAIEAVHPYGVDVSSGVEESPGVKSVDKMVRFLDSVRAVSLG
jgi:phosphoribosylanthranilate isomerase